jgi:hypothetical protein
MGLAHSPKLPDGIILCLDAANPKTQSTSNFPDLITGKNAQVLGSPILSSGNFNYFSYDGIDDAHRVDLIMGYGMTVITVARSQTDLWNDISGLGSNREPNGYIIHNNSGSTAIDYYIIGNAIQSYTFIGNHNPGSVITNWNMYGISTNGNNSHKAYFNGSVVINNSSGLSVSRNNPNTVISTDSIAEDSDQIPSRKNAIDIAYHAIWDRQLSDGEISDMYRYLQTRFGV